jgi:hypothetical protein
MNRTGCLILLSFIATVIIMCALCSCCTNVCEQDVPQMMPIPECGIYVIEDLIENPVENTGK